MFPRPRWTHAAAGDVTSARVNPSSTADVTITAPERLEASVGTKGRITCIGEPELLHTSNSLIRGEITFK